MISIFFAVLASTARSQVAPPMCCSSGGVPPPPIPEPEHIAGARCYRDNAPFTDDKAQTDPFITDADWQPMEIAQTKVYTRNMPGLFALVDCCLAECCSTNPFTFWRPFPPTMVMSCTPKESEMTNVALRVALAMTANMRYFSCVDGTDVTSNALPLRRRVEVSGVEVPVVQNHIVSNQSPMRRLGWFGRFQRSLRLFGPIVPTNDMDVCSKAMVEAEEAVEEVLAIVTLAVVIEVFPEVALVCLETEGCEKVVGAVRGRRVAPKLLNEAKKLVAQATWGATTVNTPVGKIFLPIKLPKVSFGRRRAELATAGRQRAELATALEQSKELIRGNSAAQAPPAMEGGLRLE